MWYKGKTKNYTYWVDSAYPGGESSSNLEGGRISKLSIYDENQDGKEIYSYGQGNDMNALDQEGQTAFAEILAEHN